ncbi:MAG: hypothetical protein HFH92_05745 [Lachnospiraceae bacterium]|nr:hypothetical protein [uncultured Acetatifactor sp.]MCI8788602.1 hypothetical protein [Lachnospiraceae bacterium]
MCGRKPRAGRENRKEDADSNFPEFMNLYVQDDPLGYQAHETAFAVEPGEKAVLVWNGEGLESIDVIVVSLIHLGYGTALDIRDRLLAGAEVETSVPGEYAVVAHTDQGETINLADMLEITRFEIGTSEEASGAAGVR